MKIDKSIAWSFVLLVAMASLYRVMPNRPWGFAPQIAMALFSGSVIANKKFSFLMPLGSMLASDILYESLYRLNISSIPGFYEGQVANYLVFVGLTIVGFAINKNKWSHIFIGAAGGVIIYFLVSNFMVWIGGGLGINNQPYAKTANGLYSCLVAGLPFLKGSLYATFLFSGVFFGGYHLMNKYFAKSVVAA